MVWYTGTSEPAVCVRISANNERCGLAGDIGFAIPIQQGGHANLRSQINRVDVAKFERDQHMKASARSRSTPPTIYGLANVGAR